MKREMSPQHLCQKYALPFFFSVDVEFREKDDWKYGSKPDEDTPIQTHEDPWRQCYDVVDMNDKEFCKQISKEISWLLIVVSVRVRSDFLC